MDYRSFTNWRTAPRLDDYLMSGPGGPHDDTEVPDDDDDEDDADTPDIGDPGAALEDRR